MAREGKAVMEGPKQAYIRMFFEIIEERSQINVMPVQVMEMDDVGLIFTKELNDLFGGPLGVESEVPKDPGLQGLELIVRGVPYSNRMLIVHFPLGVESDVIDAFFVQKPADGSADLPCAHGLIDDVDLDYLHFFAASSTRDAILCLIPSWITLISRSFLR